MSDTLVYALAGVFLWGLSLWASYREGRSAGFLRARAILFDSKLAEIGPWL